MEGQPTVCAPLPQWRDGEGVGSTCLQRMFCAFSFLFFFLSLSSICTELKRKKEEEKIFFRPFTHEGPVAGFPVPTLTTCRFF